MIFLQYEKSCIIISLPVLTADPMYEDEVSFTFLTFSDKFSK